MEIRLMTEEDLDEVCVIEDATFSIPWSRADFSKAVHDANQLYIVVQDDDNPQNNVTQNNSQIIGYCGLWMVAGEGQINNVAVREDYRGQGIGCQMLTRLLFLGREKGLRAFTLEVRVSNTAAIRLYEKLGFHSEGIRPGFYDRPKEDANIFWLYDEEPV